MRKNTTKEEIFYKAIELFSQRGFKGTSMRDLAKSVGIHESSIYNHYKSKEEILDSILQFQLDGFKNTQEYLKEVEFLTKDLDDPVEIWLTGVGYFIQKLPQKTNDVSKVILNERFVNEQCGRFVLEKMFPEQKLLTKTILMGLHHRGLIKDCNFDMVASQYVYMIYGLEIENSLLMLDEDKIAIAHKNLIENIKFFIENLKN